MLSSAAVALLVVTGAACDSVYTGDDAVSVPDRDAAPASDAESPKPSTDGGASPSKPDAAPLGTMTCAGGGIFCLHFDGPEPDPVADLKGSGSIGVANGDAVSAPGALKATAGSGEYAADTWAPIRTFASNDTVTVRLSFKVKAIGPSQQATILADVGFAGGAELLFAIDSVDGATGGKTYLAWIDGSTNVVSREVLGNWKTGWNQTSFAVTKAGAGPVGGSVLAQAPGSGVSGEFGVVAGLVSYASSDNSSAEVLIDDLVVDVKP